MRWNDKQRVIAKLSEEGKSFSEIVKAGHSKVTVSRVLRALKAGEKPGAVEPKDGEVKAANLATLVLPKGGITIFEFLGQKIPINPEDLVRCLDQYRDMKDLIGWQSDFSSTMREAFRMYRGALCTMFGGDNE